MAQHHSNNKQPIKVGAVSYLNTSPLIYGFEQGLMKDEISLIIDHPANIAAALLTKQIDIGLVPVAVLPLLPQAKIISNYGIAADGAVSSVCLFSEVPLHEITHILLDYESRTSVMLVKYLCKNYWHIQPVFLTASQQFRQQITGTTAGVVIGDRAFQQKKISTYCFDLAEAWKLHTGLPFVFAAWVSNVPLSSTFINRFNEATSMGLNHLSDIESAHTNLDFNLHEYYTKYINYYLDDHKIKGMELFLHWCSATQIQQSIAEDSTTT
jgi:chorismate dehydratase